jgi:hypothetical protein
MFTFALRWSVALLGIFTLCISQASAQSNDLAGRYYLSGVREVGSELLLKQDGSYKWALSYGAMDQQSQGTWKVQDGKVVLTSQALKPLRPFFSLKGVEPWSDAAASQLKRVHERSNDEKTNAFCPFIQGQVAQAGGKPMQQAQAADAAPALAYENLDAAATQKAAKSAVARLPSATSAFHVLRVKTKAEIDAFQKQRQDSESWAKASNALMKNISAYSSAEDALRKMIVQALDVDEKYRDLLDSDDLRPPIWQYAQYACSQSVQATFKEPNNAYVAIHVYDPDRGLRISSNSKAQVKFTDGSVQNITRFDSGYAMVMLRPGQSIAGISIEFQKTDVDQIKLYEFAVKADRQSVIHVLMDVTQLIPVAFETLALPIKADGLVFQRGIYKKR